MPSLPKPNPKFKFTFGLWTVGNVGRDPFGGPTRPVISPPQIADMLGEVGAYGVNFHDNDLVPIDATAAEAETIKKDFKKALKANGLMVPMATVNMFSDPVFKDGGFTSNNASVRAYAIQKTMRAMDLGNEFGAKIFVLWGGREGVESDATKSPVEAIKRMREAMNFLAEYSVDRKFNYKFAFEAKPNEPRGHIYFAVTGSYLGFIPTLDKPELFGVNPEVAHEHMAGLNFVHQVAAAIEQRKLFHIDLNDQEFGRYDQDFRFGSVNLKHAFFLVKLLEDSGYNGCRHFDSHAFRQSDMQDVKAFARGSMRTYELLAEKAKRWNEDREIQSLLSVINAQEPNLSKLTKKFSPGAAQKLLAAPLDREQLASARLPYEELDQLTMEIIMGVR
jgi:xylose isomerase